jgi:hypothetical protein
MANIMSGIWKRRKKRVKIEILHLRSQSPAEQATKTAIQPLTEISTGPDGSVPPPLP